MKTNLCSVKTKLAPVKTDCPALLENYTVKSETELRENKEVTLPKAIPLETQAGAKSNHAIPGTWLLRLDSQCHSLLLAHGCMPPKSPKEGRASISGCVRLCARVPRRKGRASMITRIGLCIPPKKGATA